VILRRDVWEANKWIARNLTDAFVRCNDLFAAAQRHFPYASPWLDCELEETEAAMGADSHPYGFEKNRNAIDIFCRQAYELGIVGRVITAEEYFAEYLASG
jgi:4,5-dihydroxyphthalate decarboxylase